MCIRDRDAYDVGSGADFQHLVYLGVTFISSADGLALAEVEQG